MHTNKGSVLIFSPDKLEKIHRSYNAEIKIKTTFKSRTQNESNSTSETSRNYNTTPENDGDCNDGYGGSRDSAGDNIIVATATNRQEISSNIVEEGQGAIPGAVTVITAIIVGSDLVC